MLRQGVQGISDIITIPGIINRDFADVKTTMAGMGYAVMGTAQRGGTNRAMEAAHAAMASPLLEEGAIDGARGILINISGSSTLKLSEVNEASTIIQNAAHEDANIIFGAVLDESLGEEIKITVIATGFRHDTPQRRERLLRPDVIEVRTTQEKGSQPVARFASEIAEDERGQSVREVNATRELAETSRVHNENRREPEAEPVRELEPVFVGVDHDRDPYPQAEPRREATPALREEQLRRSAEEEADSQLDVPAYLRQNLP